MAKKRIHKRNYFDYNRANGYVPFDKSLFDHWLSDDLEVLFIWMYLLSKSNHRGIAVNLGGELLPLASGYFTTSHRNLSLELGISLGKVQRTLNMLFERGFLSKKATSKYTIYKVVEYKSIFRRDELLTDMS